MNKQPTIYEVAVALYLLGIKINRNCPFCFSKVHGGSDGVIEHLSVMHDIVIKEEPAIHD